MDDPFKLHRQPRKYICKHARTFEFSKLKLLRSFTGWFKTKHKNRIILQTTIFNILHNY